VNSWVSNHWNPTSPTKSYKKVMVEEREKANTGKTAAKQMKRAVTPECHISFNFRKSKKV
jgi:hypothetical protein